MTIKVGQPAELNRFDKASHKGHVVAFVDPHPEQMETAFGDAEAAACGVICATCNQGWPDQRIFGAALVPRICGSPDPVVAGVLVEGEAKPGRNAPWLLDDADADDLADVQALVDKVVTQLASGRIVVDFDSLTGSAQEQF